MNYNLLATTEQISLSQACSELWMNLRAIGDPEPKVNRSRVRGVILARTSMNPVDAVHRLRAHMAEEPERYRYVYRVMPVQVWTDTSVESIVKEVASMRGVVEPGDSFRVTLEKRRTRLRSLEIIEPVAATIDRRVELEAPDWMVLVEIMGNETGISIVRPLDTLNVQKERATSLSQ
jgi:tRNA acetyltransferase TAN1